MGGLGKNGTSTARKKGLGGTIYFQDMWELFHNSHNNGFSFLDMIQTSIDETIYMHNIVIPKICSTISANDGIIQKNIYALLPDIEKSLIQRTLRKLESDNIITRTKKSNSYELHLL